VSIGGRPEFDYLARRGVLPMVYCALTPRAGHSVLSGETNNMSGILMSFKKRVPASLALSLAICMGPATAHAADGGLITKPSKYSVEETVARFEAAVKQKEAAGFTVFTEIDHAAVAKKFGLHMRPRTVIVFGNPKLGNPPWSRRHCWRSTCRLRRWSGRTIKARFDCRIILPTIYTTGSTRGTVRRHLRQPRHSQTLGRDQRSGDEVDQLGRSQRLKGEKLANHLSAASDQIRVDDLCRCRNDSRLHHSPTMLARADEVIE